MKQNYPKIGIRPTIDGRQGGIREGLEEKTMNLAKAVKNLIESNLRNGDGSKVECVISETTIGRVGESAACAAQFEREGVGSTITVTSCWCYGSETMDMNPTYPKAVWGFNGTERPGAVYLAAVLAAHAQKGLPAYGIYGHDVQDLNDNTIPADVAEKILRFARAAQAVATMRGKSYLSLGNTCMGIAGSIVNADFLQQYLGMRTEYVSLVEILRRVDFGIYDKEEFAKAMAWVEKYCKPQEGHDYNEDRPLFPGVPMTTFNGKGKGKNRQEKDEDWEFTVKNMMIIRDLMQGSEKLLEMGYKEEAIGHNAIAAGVQGQRQWTDYKPNFDFPESLMCTSFDWNGPREAYTLATENDFLNGMSMLFGHLLTNRGVMFSDIRTYWSPEAVERVAGKSRGSGRWRLHSPHQQWCHNARCYRCHDRQERTAHDEGALEHDQRRRGGLSEGYLMDACRPRLFPWRRLFEPLPDEGWHAHDHAAPEPRRRTGSRAADCRGMDGRAGREDQRHSGQAYRPDMAYHVVCSASGCYEGCLQGCLFRDEQLGCQPWCYLLWSCRCRPHHAGCHAAHSCLHAQRGGQGYLPSCLLE